MKKLEFVSFGRRGVVQRVDRARIENFENSLPLACALDRGPPIVNRKTKLQVLQGGTLGFGGNPT